MESERNKDSASDSQMANEHGEAIRKDLDGELAPKESSSQWKKHETEEPMAIQQKHSINPSTNPSKCLVNIPIVPNLTITPENDVVFTSSSASVVSSATSSPKLPIKNQQHNLVKGLYALSVSDTSDVPSSLSSSPRSKILPSFYSPKLGRRFESVPDYRSASSSPTSPSRKFFRLMSSPTSFAGGKRRGSEPLLDGKDLSEVQLSLTDRRWEKLRAILVAMKNEPFDHDSVLGSLSSTNSPDKRMMMMSDSLKEHIDVQEELGGLRKELDTLHAELELKECKLQEAETDRDVALAYIKTMQLAGKDTEVDENRNRLTQADGNKTGISGCPNEPGDRDSSVATFNVYYKELESLRQEGADKEAVLSMLCRVVEELRVERSYLNHLMRVVLLRAPWMLDEVDKGGHWMEEDDDDGCRAYSSDDNDDEVWC